MVGAIKMRGTTKEITAYICNRISPPVKQERKNWKKELKAERNKVIDEAIRTLRDKQRGLPVVWQRGYDSAVTTLELMKC